MKIVIVNQEREETVSSITYVVDLFNRLFNSGTSKYARIGSVFFNLTYAFDRSQNSCNPRKANLTKGTKNE